ncbi:hypothetical protein [Limibacillus halophilus]|uniref:Uncharacterized protein n=1 Tax=Limibacillus halophilus TaxID=1579333 RepID=A0A839SVL0_9PROT|nr:hypothetical protein [Limibacillus halophilus]MBB3066837.1 hypothetical protein [Limibacillus halophilus]
MALNLETFSSRKGGNTFYKAISHPLVARDAEAFLERLSNRKVALYDPLDLLSTFHQIHDLSGLKISGLYVQDLGDVGKTLCGQTTRPVTELPRCDADCVLLIAYDADRLKEHIRHLLPETAELVSLDDGLRLPDGFLTDRNSYLAPLNFATNFAFFRDDGGLHTRLTTTNYWSGYGAEAPQIWCCLFDQQGRVLAQWNEEPADSYAAIAIESETVRERFGLAGFTGQLFLHVIGSAGHDVVKYALETYGDLDNVLSATHDANAWPADRYAGLPAPAAGEEVLLWVQNSHPCPIPAGAIGLSRMGDERIVTLDEQVPAFATLPLDTKRLLPEVRWPAQIEIHAGKHMVRPRYEVLWRVEADGPKAPFRRRIAHPNVERSDLTLDPAIRKAMPALGKGYLLPAPILPIKRYRSLALATPMSSAQTSLPLAVALYDPQGKELLRQPLGLLPRDHALELDMDALLPDGLAGEEHPESGGWGHMELFYDFSDGGEADGWLHALFRYHDRQSGHAADTSFGAHIFNSVITFKGEPQSYAGHPPGLSTRLYLPVAPLPWRTFCHLIYPASTPWHPHSQTTLTLHDGTGRPVASENLEIACSGSRLWDPATLYGSETLESAGPNAYVIIRDSSCRLFGYHGVERGSDAFSLDHMFGF